MIKNGLMLLVAVCFLMGCSANAVVFEPTPLPPDLSPLIYGHPSGAFSLVAPRTWALYEQNLPDLAAAHFTPPGAAQAMISVAVMRLQAEQPIADLVSRYQREIRPDVLRYTEQDRQTLPDGTWRIVGLRANAGLPPQMVNTFILRQPPFVGVIEALLLDEAHQTALEMMVNTFTLNLEGTLQPADLLTLSRVADAAVEVASVTSWLAPTGVYFVTGEVVNRSAETLREVPMRVILEGPDGTGIAEAIDKVMGYALPPGEFAPFSLRFGQGQPQDAARYTLTLGGGDDWQPEVITPGTLAGADALTWAHEATLNEEGHFLINGVLTNTGSRRVYAPLATVTVFDERRNVIAAGFSPVQAAVLPPGESVSFEIHVPELGGSPVNYIVNIQAWLQNPADEA